MRVKAAGPRARSGIAARMGRPAPADLAADRLVVAAVAGHVFI
jgi:hypothetical protein